VAKTRPTIPASPASRAKRPATASRQRSSSATSPESATVAAPSKAPRAKSSSKPASKPKVVSTQLERGRFAMPATEFKQIAALKSRAMSLGRPAKKNELLRIGLSLASLLSDETLVIALDQLEPIKTAKLKKRKPAARANS